MSENGRSHSEVYSDRVDPGGVVDALKVLAHPVRLQILQWLRDPRAEFPIERGIADPDEYGVCIKQITDRWGSPSRPYRPSCEPWNVRAW